MANTKKSETPAVTPEDILAEAKAEAAKMIEEAKAEAEKIKAEAEATPTETTTDSANDEYEKWLQEKVTIKLFKDNDKYKDDVFVSVNGNKFLIKRGVEVEVPRYIKNALDLSEEQKGYAANVSEEYENDYQQRLSELGLN